MRLVIKPMVFAGIQYYTCAAVSFDGAILGMTRFNSEAGCVNWFRSNPEWFNMDLMEPEFIHAGSATSARVIERTRDKYVTISIKDNTHTTVYVCELEHE